MDKPDWFQSISIMFRLIMFNIVAVETMRIEIPDIA